MTTSMSHDSRQRFRPLRIALLAGVPIAAWACWIALQPADRMLAPDSTLQWRSLLYDPYDVSAMAQRGMNAELHRQAGAPAMPKYVPWYSFSRLIEAPRPPKPRYFLEYPHSLLLLFRAGYWIQPDWQEFKNHPDRIPPGLPDCCYHNIAMHNPETENQFTIWRFFVVATRFYVSVMALAWLLLIVVLERGYGPGTELSGGSLLLLLPGAVFFTLNRFDILPALMTALAFACLGRRRIVGAGLFLGLATVLKIYPILFAPLVLRYLWPERRLALRFALAYATANLLSLAPALFGDDWRAISAPYLFQLTRTPEPGLTIYGCILPVQLAHGLTGAMVRFGALATVMLLALATPIASMSSLLRRCSLVLIVFVSLAVFYSPQWLLWFAPLLLPLLGGDRRIGKWVIALDAVTYLTFPIWFFILSDVGSEITKWFYEFPAGGRDGASDEFLQDILTHFGSLLRLARFVCLGFMTWYIVGGEYPVRTWYDRLRRRIWGAAPALTREV